MPGLALGDEPEPQPVVLRYQDSHEYRDVFAPLVKLAAVHDKRTREAQVHQNVVVHWSWSQNNKLRAFFALPNLSDEVKLEKGDKLRLYFPDTRKPRWIRLGTVVKTPDSELCVCLLYVLHLHRTHSGRSSEVGIELRSNVDVTADTCGISVQMVWNPTSFDRFFTGLVLVKTA